MAEQKKKRFKFKYGIPRFLVQLVSLLLLNGLLLAELYPNLNLQRYPVTLPILLSINAPTNLAYGSLDVIQVALASPVAPWVALAFVFVIGAVIGRAFCGWVCPMGFIQDMVTMARGPFGQVDVRMHESGKRFKYFVLGVALLVSVSLAISLSMGIGADYKNSLGIFANGLLIPLAPEGTLFSTIPRAIIYLKLEVAPTFLDKISANQLVTWIRSVPLMIYAGLILLFVFFYGAYKVPRFWCRYLCPVGAKMAPFQKYSFLGMKRDPVKCSKCPHCEAACPMQIRILSLPWEKFNDPECILCGECADACVNNSLSYKFP
ncbi:MAG: 4Fe-4S binding protein [Candidatus Bathyarchaeia archaeon]